MRNGVQGNRFHCGCIKMYFLLTYLTGTLRTNCNGLYDNIFIHLYSIGIQWGLHIGNAAVQCIMYFRVIKRLKSNPGFSFIGSRNNINVHIINVLAKIITSIPVDSQQSR